MNDHYRVGKKYAQNLDAADSMSKFRKRFFIPEKLIYMVGNSLGLMSKDSDKAIKRIVQEWKLLGISGWLQAKQPWFYYAEKLGKTASKLVGAEPDEVVATGSTTVNIHSLISTLYKPRGKRKKILADELNFPSDIYALKGQIKLKGLDPKKNLILISSTDGYSLDEEKIIKNMTDEIAIILLPSVLYRSSQLLDIPTLCQKAHQKKITIGFDCSHSVGAIPHFFDRWEVDFGMWCSYKYMNGGPGSSAFLYLNKKHFKEEPLLAGWFGYKKEEQFRFSLDFNSAQSAGGWQISSPGILSAAAVEGALKITIEAGINNIRKKSKNLTSYLIYLVDTILSDYPYSFKIISPRETDFRGGHVAIERDEDAWPINQALKQKGVISDFRPPGTIRIAPVALYNTYEEVWQVVQYLKDIIDQGEYKKITSEKNEIT